MSAISADLKSLEPLVPGAVAVVRVGTQSQATAFGQADVAAKRAMSLEDRFQIGSITKTMIATLVLQLVADGKLALSDTTEDLLPGLLPRGEEITVEHLLSHRSGLHNYTDVTGLDLAHHWQPRAIIRVATRRPLLFEPGTQSSYSNTNYIVLGLIVEEVTGRRVARVLETQIFDPAGMSATSLDPRRVVEPRSPTATRRAPT